MGEGEREEEVMLDEARETSSFDRLIDYIKNRIRLKRDYPEEELLLCIYNMSVLLCFFFHPRPLLAFFRLVSWHQITQGDDVVEWSGMENCRPACNPIQERKRKEEQEQKASAMTPVPSSPS